MTAKGPNIPLPDMPAGAKCICGSRRAYRDCCRPRLSKLNRATGSLEQWRENETYNKIFQAYSDLLWEEQYRDEQQGHTAQEYEEWDEWASYLWMEGILLDGFILGDTPPVPDLLWERVCSGERIQGGRQTLQALLRSFEGIYEIEALPPPDRPGLVDLKLPPSLGVTARVPRIFLPSDAELTDMVIGRFVTLNKLSYPTHRPLVIPVLPDGSNFDAAYRILAPLFPADFDSPATGKMMVRQMKARGDLILRAALEALVPLENVEIRSGSFPMAADGGEIRYMVSDSEAVESNLDHSPFFELMNPLDQSELTEEMAELLEQETLPLGPEGPRWNLQFSPEARRRLRPIERRQVEDLLWTLVQRVRPPFGIDPFEHWAKNPGMIAILDREEGTLTARAFLAQPLELGRYMLEREAGSFLARESEEHLVS